MTKDVAVSKLSKLQKQVLVYARRQMLTKGQTIKEPTQVTVCLPAPDWLGKALNQAMSAILEARKYYLLGEIEVYKFHPWIRFFEEMRFLRQTIGDAAREAGEKTTHVDPLALYELANPFVFTMLRAAQPIAVHPWPYFDRGWYFMIDVKGMTAEQLTEKLEWLCDEKNRAGLWVTTNKTYPVN
jgi:hypothetical protein